MPGVEPRSSASVGQELYSITLDSDGQEIVFQESDASYNLEGDFKSRIMRQVDRSYALDINFLTAGVQTIERLPSAAVTWVQTTSGWAPVIPAEV